MAASPLSLAIGATVGAVAVYVLAPGKSKKAQIKVGANIPAVTVMSKPSVGKAKPVNLAEYCANKKVIIMGLPGAFTPC